MGKDCSLQSFCISTIHGGHAVGRVMQDAYMDVSGRTTQETKSIGYRESLCPGAAIAFFLDDWLDLFLSR